MREPRRLLIGALALGLIALVLGAIAGHLLSNDDGEDDLNARFSERADAAAALIAVTVDSFTPPVLDNLSPELFEGRVPAGTIARLYPDSKAALLGAGGTLIDSAGRADPPLDVGRLIRSDHVAAAFGGEIGLSDLNRPGDGSSATLEIAFPIAGGGSGPGARALVFQFDARIARLFYSDVLGRLEDEGSGRLALLDSTGAPIAGEKPAFLEGLPAERGGTIDGPDDEFVYELSPIPGTQWRLLAVIETDVLYRPIGGSNVVFFLVLLALGVVGVLGIVALARFLRAAEQIRRANENLELRNREVEEATEAKDRFLAAMSHELRTPLTAIIGFSQLLRDGQVGDVDEQQKACLDDVLTSAEHLKNLVDEALDVSAAEAGKLKIEPQHCSPSEETKAACAMLAAVATERGIELDLAGIREVNDAIVDPGRYRQVVLNYLSNALKFTEPGGRVSVRVLGVGDGSFRLEVTDTGTGIAADHIEKLFRDFSQVGTPVAKGVRGTGLGLSVTKRIVELQGGQVGAESIEGRGSTFWAEFPVGRDTADTGSRKRSAARDG